MITNNTYYRGPIYIPQAKPSITEDVIDSSSDFAMIVDMYEEDCLVKSLGVKLAYEFLDQLDSSKPNGLKDGADAKWDRLLNGHQYTPSGEADQVEWRGIRYKTPRSFTKPNTSFLADYVFFFYERKQYNTTTNVGTGQVESENMVLTSPRQKVVEAWNRFVEQVQGKEVTPNYLVNNTGLTGVDFYTGDTHITLYKFIADMNELSGDVDYPDFKPKQWEFLNKFGI